METVSDNSGNRSRGRPRKYESRGSYLTEFEDIAPKELYGATFTVRQQQNVVLANRALDRLYEEDEDLGDVACRWPQTVMTELGRIEDDEQFWKAARWYDRYGSKLRAHDAAKSIRYHFRLHPNFA